jgi:hypothetical protein
MDANTRDFEVELQAREERNEMPQAQLHQEATVITATAL